MRTIPPAVIGGHRTGQLRILGRPVQREAALLGAAVLLGLAIRLAFVLATSGHSPAGDEIEYDMQGRFITEGKWFWSTIPYGIAHASLNKPPGYPLWVGLWYSVLGHHLDGVLLVQALIGPVVIVLTWLLAARLFGTRVALVAAFAVAVYPFAWQFETRLFSESVATPLALGVLIAVLEREVTPRRAAGVGLLMGVSMLVSPRAAPLFAAIAASFLVAAGWRRGAALTAITIAVAALVIAPWTYRNHEVDGHFVPLSNQDQSMYGTFNDDAASDHAHPYAWRPLPSRDRDLFDRRHRLSDGELRSRLIARARAYIGDHPASVPQAFFWNGLVRFWDLRSPHEAVDLETRYDGRSRVLSRVGLVAYWIALALALLAVWRLRRRRGLLLPLLALAIAASAMNTVEAHTRYRAPFEPLLCVLAASAVVPGQRNTRASGPRSRSLWGARAPAGGERTNAS